MTRLNTIRNYIDILIFYFCVVRIVDEFYGERGGGKKKEFCQFILYGEVTFTSNNFSIGFQVVKTCGWTIKSRINLILREFAATRV